MVENGPNSFVTASWVTTTWTAENLAEELFPEDDDGDDFHEQTLERVEAAIADKEWN